MSRWKITFIPLVPSMILQLVNTPEWEKADTSTIDSLASGAAFLPPELHAKLQSKMKAIIIQGYGLSESVRVPLFASAILEGFIS